MQYVGTLVVLRDDSESLEEAGKLGWGTAIPKARLVHSLLSAWDVVDYINWFPNVQPILPALDKFHLVVVHNFFHTLLDLIG